MLYIHRNLDAIIYYHCNVVCTLLKYAYENTMSHVTKTAKFTNNNMFCHFITNTSKHEYIDRAVYKCIPKKFEIMKTLNHTGNKYRIPIRDIAVCKMNGIVDTTNAKQMISTFLPERTVYRVKDGTEATLLLSPPSDITCAVI